MSKKQVIELEWFNINEKLPDPYTDILFKTQLNKYITAGYYCYRNGSRIKTEDDKYYLIKDITEWCYYPNFSYSKQDININLYPSLEVDDGSIVLTEDKLNELINEVDNVRI